MQRPAVGRNNIMHHYRLELTSQKAVLQKRTYDFWWVIYTWASNKPLLQRKPNVSSTVCHQDKRGNPSPPLSTAKTVSPVLSLILGCPRQEGHRVRINNWDFSVNKTRDDDSKLKYRKFHLYIGKMFLILRMVKHWNRLPRGGDAQNETRDGPEQTALFHCDSSRVLRLDLQTFIPQPQLLCDSINSLIPRFQSS